MVDRKWFGTEYESTESQKFVGMKRSDVLISARDAGIPVRVIEDGTKAFLTADRNRSRLNVFVVDGIVTKAAFF